MKMLYTKEELLELTSDELLDIISIISLDGRVIFLDNVVMIETDCLVMDEGQDNINITSPESFKLISDKMTRFKMLKATGSLNDLKEKNHLEKLIITRLDTIDININAQLAEINDNMNKNFSQIAKHVGTVIGTLQAGLQSQIDNISESLSNKVMEQLIPEVRKINDQSVVLSSTLADVQDKIRRINFTKLTTVTDSLENISKLLSEVIED